MDIVAKGLIIEAVIPITYHSEDDVLNTEEGMDTYKMDCLCVAKGIASYIEAFGMPPFSKPMEDDHYVAQEFGVAFEGEDGHPWCIEDVRIFNNKATFHMLSGY
jgi:hypothetical protein